MAKRFSQILKEYGDAFFSGTGGFSIGSLDAFKPIASLGSTDKPPENTGRVRGTKANTAPYKKRKKPRIDRLEDEKNPRIARKKGQHKNSSSHSDLYTDENPKGTIHGLGFKDVKTAKKSVAKIKGSGKKHAHKIQAAVAMEQRAREMGKTAEAAIFRKYINQMKEKTTKLQKESALYQHLRDRKLI